MSVMVTYRGATEADDSEPHREIGARTDVLCETIFGPDASIFGRRDGNDLIRSVNRSIAAACSGSIGVVKVAGSGFERTSIIDSFTLPVRICGSASRINASKRKFEASGVVSREDAILGIINAHPGAAFVFCNGYTSRCARALADDAANFYNIGYMGGSLAIGWGLATARPDREIVVVDGDQNALMSCMKDHMATGAPGNLHWYVLNNGIGASVGTARSIELGAPIENSANVIRTIADKPGSFVYPRVRIGGANVEPEIGNAESLVAFSRRFRRFFES